MPFIAAASLWDGPMEELAEKLGEFSVISFGAYSRCQEHATVARMRGLLTHDITWAFPGGRVLALRETVCA